MMGREVARLADGVQTPGRHTLTFDAQGLSSGIYVCRLLTRGGIATRRMILRK
jgi:hypothetical protein